MLIWLRIGYLAHMRVGSIRRYSIASEAVKPKQGAQSVTLSHMQIASQPRRGMPESKLINT